METYWEFLGGQSQNCLERGLAALKGVELWSRPKAKRSFAPGEAEGLASGTWPQPLRRSKSLSISSMSSHRITQPGPVWYCPLWPGAGALGAPG